jgi:hypothetical protein
MKISIDNISDSNTINEMFIRVEESLPTNVENSMLYSRLKQLLKKEMFSFMKEQIELRDDLNKIIPMIGDAVPEYKIREMFDALVAKYNSKDNNNAIAYHIEATRVDYGVPVFVIIFRGQVLVKKFVFRFRKEKLGKGLDSVSSSGVPKR